MAIARQKTSPTMLGAFQHCFERPDIVLSIPNIVVGVPTLFRPSRHCWEPPNIVPSFPNNVSSVPTMLLAFSQGWSAPDNALTRFHHVFGVFLMFLEVLAEKISRTLRKCLQAPESLSRSSTGETLAACPALNPATSASRRIPVSADGAHRHRPPSLTPIPGCAQPLVAAWTARTRHPFGWPETTP